MRRKSVETISVDVGCIYIFTDFSVVDFKFWNGFKRFSLRVQYWFRTCTRLKYCEFRENWSEIFDFLRNMEVIRKINISSSLCWKILFINEKDIFKRNSNKSIRGWKRAVLLFVMKNCSIFNTSEWGFPWLTGGVIQWHTSAISYLWKPMNGIWKWGNIISKYTRRSLGAYVSSI